MVTKQKQEKQAGQQLWRRAILLTVIVLLGYLLVTQVKSLSPSLSIIRHAELVYVLVGVAGMAATLFVATMTYELLALHKLHYGRTLLIQVASGFTNRLLPAGLGGMGLIVQYLRRQKHSTSEAITVVGVDNVIGIVGHFSLFFVVIGVTNVSSRSIHLPHVSWIVLLAILVVLVLSGSMKRVRERLEGLLRHIGRDLRNYWKQPLRLVLAYGNSMLLTVVYVGILWASTRAVGVDLSFPKVLVVFTAGSIIGTATPTPGGLVGTEAGLFAGFLAYGLSSGTALAAALLYRLLTYWLPIVPGLVGFWFAERRSRLMS